MAKTFGEEADSGQIQILRECLGSPKSRGAVTVDITPPLLVPFSHA